jgi:hypothetical protein
MEIQKESPKSICLQPMTEIVEAMNRALAEDAYAKKYEHEQENCFDDVSTEERKDKSYMGIAPTLKNTSLSVLVYAEKYWATRVAKEAFAIVGNADVGFCCEVDEAGPEDGKFEITAITDPDLPIPGGYLSISVDGDPEEVLDIEANFLDYLSKIGADCSQPRPDYVFTMPDNTKFEFSLLDGTRKLNTRLAKLALRLSAAEDFRVALVCTVEKKVKDTKGPKSRKHVNAEANAVPATDKPKSGTHDSTAENTTESKETETILIQDPKLPIPPGLLSVVFDGEPLAILSIATKMMAYLAKIPVARQSKAGCIVFAVRRQPPKKRNPARIHKTLHAQIFL